MISRLIWALAENVARTKSSNAASAVNTTTRVWLAGVGDRLIRMYSRSYSSCVDHCPGVPADAAAGAALLTVALMVWPVWLVDMKFSGSTGWISLPVR